jgi:hypothetical protein
MFVHGEPVDLADEKVRETVTSMKPIAAAQPEKEIPVIGFTALLRSRAIAPRSNSKAVSSVYSKNKVRI